MEYTVVTHVNKNRFVKMVNDLIGKGWEIVGPASVIQERTGTQLYETRFTQTMTKREIPKINWDPRKSASGKTERSETLLKKDKVQ